MAVRQPDSSKLSALNGRPPNLSLALSSSTLGGIVYYPRPQPTSQKEPQGLRAPLTPGFASSAPTRSPGKNLYGSLSSAIGPARNRSRVNYTISEDASDSNLLNRCSSLLAILDESVVQQLLILIGSEHKRKGQDHHIVHNAPVAPPPFPRKDSPTRKKVTSSAGIGCPLAPGQVVQALHAAYVTKQQVAQIFKTFWQLAYPRYALTRRQAWYHIRELPSDLIESNLRKELDKLIKSKGSPEPTPVSITVFVTLVSTILFDACAFDEMARFFGILGGGEDTVRVACLRDAIMSSDDSTLVPELDRMIRDLDTMDIGTIKCL
ncbi:uncharacterized protein BKCO1_37000160 [Diplodia corticola]|uniref:Uncharacterized protein n=1 Tax=Diplodia corticola TaxID=236234 RepID=A0A1J9RW92_9PEZI|nr:uncharacterized protein BKCO1_37000160 [Diplodia corticola]OJD32647.1 hypothetical protein BKCO1_37000160 [Diplodia corticola]